MQAGRGACLVLRAIRKSVDEVLRSMAKDFDGLYAKMGRPPPAISTLPLGRSVAVCRARGTVMLPVAVNVVR